MRMTSVDISRVNTHTHTQSQSILMGNFTIASALWVRDAVKATWKLIYTAHATLGENIILSNRFLTWRLTHTARTHTCNSMSNYKYNLRSEYNVRLPHENMKFWMLRTCIFAMNKLNEHTISMFNVSNRVHRVRVVWPATLKPTLFVHRHFIVSMATIHVTRSAFY